MRYGRHIAYGVVGVVALFALLVFVGLEALSSGAGQPGSRGRPFR